MAATRLLVKLSFLVYSSERKHSCSARKTSHASIRKGSSALLSGLRLDYSPAKKAGQGYMLLKERN